MLPAPYQTFRTRIADLTREHSLEDQLAVHIHGQLHTKGILLTSCLLMGSMNLTYNGMSPTGLISFWPFGVLPSRAG